MAFSSVAALAAGTVETATVLGALTEIGIASTVVGAVTGSKDLMKFGGALSLVGGVGGMINGAIDSAGVAAANNATDSAMIDVANSGATGAASTVADAGASAGGGEALETVANEGADATVSNLAQNEAMSNPLADKTLPQNTAPGVQGNSTNALDRAPGMNSGTTDPFKGNNQSAYSADGTTPSYMADTSTAVSSSPVKSGDFFQGMLTWINANPKATNALIQLGGGALKGMSDASIADKQLAVKNRELDQRQYGNQVATITNPRSIINSVRA